MRKPDVVVRFSRNYIHTALSDSNFSSFSQLYQIGLTTYSVMLVYFRHILSPSPLDILVKLISLINVLHILILRICLGNNRQVFV